MPHHSQRQQRKHEHRCRPIISDKYSNNETLKLSGLNQWSPAAIAQAIGVGVRTVERYLSKPDFPEVPDHRPTFGRSILDLYKPKLLDWWNAGIRQPAILMKRLQPPGYDGTTRTLQRAIRGGRQAQGLSPIRIKVRQPLPKIADPPSPPLTPRKAAYRIVTRPENRPSEEAARLETGVPQHPELALIVERADAFLELLRQKQADSLDGWITKALTSSVKAFETFAKGILDDYLAVKATLT